MDFTIRVSPGVLRLLSEAWADTIKPLVSQHLDYHETHSAHRQCWTVLCCIHSETMTAQEVTIIHDKAGDTVWVGLGGELPKPDASAETTQRFAVADDKWVGLTRALNG